MRFSWEDDPDAVPVDELRRYARQQCKHRSQREIATEIGLRRTTLRNFVTRETNPHPRVRNLLHKWYRAHAVRDGAAAAALALLLDGLPAEIVVVAFGRLLDTVEWAHREARREPPAWLATVRTVDASGGARVNDEFRPCPLPLVSEAKHESSASIREGADG